MTLGVLVLVLLFVMVQNGIEDAMAASLQRRYHLRRTFGKAFGRLLKGAAVKTNLQRLTRSNQEVVVVGRNQHVPRFTSADGKPNT